MRNIFEIKDNFALYRDVESVLEYGDVNAVHLPKVSIVIPCYNHPDYFEMALRSALDQNYKDAYEIVVVDNDDSVEVTKNRKVVEKYNSPKVLYYHNKKNIGMFGNWNRCIELARAPYLTFLHDDDILLPRCLQILMTCQERHGGKAILGLHNFINGNGSVFYDGNFVGTKRGIFKYKQEYEEKLWHFFINPYGYCIGSLFNRDSMLELGGYSPDFYPSADAAFCVLYIRKYGAVQLLKVTHNYRFAENESYTAYQGFPVVARHIRQCISPLLPVPGFILNRIIEAMYRCSVYGMELAFNKGQIPVPEPSIVDRFIEKMSYKLHGFSKYTL